MAAEKIGQVRTGSGKRWIVQWDPGSKEVYCGPNVGTYRVGKAQSAAEAMRLAEAYCYNK